MRKKALALILVFLLASLVAAGCGGAKQSAPNNSESSQAKTTKLVVGATAKPHAEILEVVKPMLAKEGVDLEIKVFTDYVLLNPALDEKQIDANFFQHIPYLEDYNKKNGKNLVWVTKVHIEPMGVYSKKVKSIDEIKDGAKIGIPNDATNGGRALNVLAASGLIKLRDGVGVTATDADIVDNPKHIKIQMMDAPMLPRSLDDLDAAVINGNYALEANLRAKDAILLEPKDSPFANVLVVRPEDKDNPAIKKLSAALTSPEVKKFLEEKYADSVIPAF